MPLVGIIAIRSLSAVSSLSYSASTVMGQYDILNVAVPVVKSTGFSLMTMPFVSLSMIFLGTKPDAPTAVTVNSSSHFAASTDALTVPYSEETAVMLFSAVVSTMAAFRSRARIPSL